MIAGATRTSYESRARILKALAHPSRLMMVEVLAHGERCVCELTDLVGSDMSTVSKHLSLLKDAGIVQCDKRGLKVFYSLRATCVMDFFDCLDVAEKEGVCCWRPSRGRA